MDLKRNLTISGAIVEIEALAQLIKNVIDKEYSVIEGTKLPISFAGLTTSLAQLPNDAPIRFIVMTDIGTERPLSKVSMTMGDLRKLDRILSAFKEIAEGNGP